jgi:hypothetical protein
MKSQVNELLHVAAGICEDAWRTYPELKVGLSKDLDRLTLYCQARGQSIFLLDLPHLESLLLAGLESGRLCLEGPLSKRKSPKCHVPLLFAGLWLRVFDKDSCLKHEVDVNALFFLRQLLVIGKRIEVVCSDSRIESKITDYHNIEATLRLPSFTWQDDELIFRGIGRNLDEFQYPSRPGRNVDHRMGSTLSSDGPSLYEEGPKVDEVSNRNGTEEDELERDLTRVHLAQCVDHLYPFHYDKVGLFARRDRALHAERVDRIRLLSQIQRVADLIIGSFDEFDPESYSAFLEESGKGIGFKHGPGAVAERLKQHEKSCFPNWPAKLNHVFPYDTCGRTVGSPLERPSLHEMASRLICVPKTAKGPRLIAAEPTSHQWCQQLLLRFLFDQCRATFGSHFIDFRDQNKSADMVYSASLDRKLATVDLSDASDRLTCWTVERVFRRNPSLLRALHAARTRYIRDDNLGYPNFLSLRKFASQGTATTFPVMSLVMLCIALGCSIPDYTNITLATLRKWRTRVRVFGDDIILPEHGYERLVIAMEALQLKVNVAKSYVKGHFRESCGADGFMGFDITPSKPRTLIADSPASVQAVLDTSNNLFNKGLWYASRAALDLISPQIRKHLRIVGPNGAGFSGLQAYSGGYEYHLAKRWNSRLHRHEVRVWNLRTRTERLERGDFDGLLDFFARAHSLGNPRVVSDYVSRRKTNSRLLWEPQNTDAQCYDRLSYQGPSVLDTPSFTGKVRRKTRKL